MSQYFDCPVCDASKSIRVDVSNQCDEDDVFSCTVTMNPPSCGCDVSITDWNRIWRSVDMHEKVPKVYTYKVPYTLEEGTQP